MLLDEMNAQGAIEKKLLRARGPLARLLASDHLDLLGETGLNHWSEKSIWAARGCRENHKDNRGRAVLGPGGKPLSRRAPINPNTGGKALTNKPATWGTYEVAWKRQARWPDDERQPGVGLMLGEAHGGGLVRAALDLDGVEGWPEGVLAEIITRFDTYAEASPSGGGVRLVFTITQETLAALGGKGRVVSAGEHIEIALKITGFVTITGQPGPEGSHRCGLMNVPLEALLWLVDDCAPAWKAALSESGETRDDSGSGHAWRCVSNFMRDGMDDGEVAELLAEDDGPAGEWWARVDDRQRNRTIMRAREKADEEAAKIVDQLDDLEDDDDTSKTGASAIDHMNARHGLVYLGTSGLVADFAGDHVEFRSVTAFKEMHGNKKVDGKKLGTLWLEHPRRRTFDLGVVFDPSGRAPAGALNLWRGFAVHPDPEADCGLILDYIRDVVAAGDPGHADYILTWLADLVQNPARKPGVALVLRGLKGVGKDTLAEIMRLIIGKYHVAHVTNSGRVADRFNSQFSTALLAHFEEATWGGNRDGKGTLQSLITSPQMPLERKGVDVVQVDSFVRLILTANDEWVVPATADERRYAVFEVPASKKGDTAYWDALYRQIENGGLPGFLAFLEGWQVPKGVEVRRPPQTAGLTGQKLAGLRNVDAWWYGALVEGDLPGYQPDALDGEDWAAGAKIVNRTNLRKQYDDWMQRQRFHGEALDPAAFGKGIKRLCPELKTTRVRDGESRPYCYSFPDLSSCRESFAQMLNADPSEMPWSVENP